MKYESPADVKSAAGTIGSSLSIFPNPATTQLTISATDPITSIDICDLLGQTMYSQQYNTTLVEIAIEALSPGVYFAKVNGTEVRKFLKQ